MGLFGSLSYFIAQRTLWLGRANNAWGPSRVWNSGASWETDANNAWGASGVYGSGLPYSAQLPPASVDHLAASGSCPSDGATHANVASLTLDRGGNWIIVFAGDNQSGGGTVRVTGFSAGVNQLGTPTGGTPDGIEPIGYAFQAGFTIGTVISISVLGTGGTTRHGYIDAFFLPTLTNPN